MGGHGVDMSGQSQQVQRERLTKYALTDGPSASSWPCSGGLGMVPWLEGRASTAAGFSTSPSGARVAMSRGLIQ